MRGGLQEGKAATVYMTVRLRGAGGGRHVGGKESSIGSYGRSPRVKRKGWGVELRGIWGAPCHTLSPEQWCS